MKKLFALLLAVLLLAGSAAAEDLSSRVVPGKDGWLFYTNLADGDPIGDYTGTREMSEETLAKIAAQMQHASDVMEARGGRFVLFIAPNKERVYSEYMPDALGAPAEQYRMKQVMDYLQASTSVDMVYVYDDLMQAKVEIAPDVLYYRHDTHWNDLGAYVGVRALCRHLGIEMPGLDEITIASRETDECNHDLGTFLGLEGDALIDNVYALAGYTERVPQYLVWEFTGNFDSHCDGADPRRLMVVRDSFCTSMLPYLAPQFEDSRMTHYFTFTPAMVDEYQPDVLVYEVVERCVEQLEHFSLEGI